MQEQLGNVFDALYDRLILRDLTAKLVPGTLVIAALVVAFSSTNILFDIISSTPWFLWILFPGLAWTVGFSVQSIGESFRLKRVYYPQDEFTSDREFFRLRNQFATCATPTDRSTSERLVAIYEASANCAVAVWVCMFILSVDWVVESVSENQWSALGADLRSALAGYSVPAAIVLLLTWFLIRLHRVVINEYIQHMRATCESSPADSQSNEQT